MKVEMSKAPAISNRFDVEDIRKIREYHSMRYTNMTPSEIAEDIKRSTADSMKFLRGKNVKIVRLL